MIFSQCAQSIIQILIVMLAEERWDSIFFRISYGLGLLLCPFPPNEDFSDLPTALPVPPRRAPFLVLELKLKLHLLKLEMHWCCRTIMI